MESSAEILGYIGCHTCNEPKAIKRCKGKRKNFVMGNCGCGSDQRTGKAAQAELNAFKPLDVVEAVLRVRQDKANKPNDAQSKPNLNPINAQSDTESETLSKPNVDEVPKPNDESNNDPESEPLNISKCVGLGSMIGLIFGLIIR